MKFGSHDSNLDQELSEADHMVGRLAGTMDRMTEPEIRQALLAKEITALCREELSEFFTARAEGRACSPSVLSALNTFQKFVGEPLPTARMFSDFHGMLHGDDASGRRAEHLFGSAADSLKGDKPFLIRAGLMLCETTLLEPELPGAQRTGQLLFSSLFVSGSVVPWPGLGLSAFLNATSADHLKLCKAAEKAGNPAKWMSYYLNGVARQCEDVIGRITRIEDLIRKWEPIVEGRRHEIAAQLLAGLAGNPFLTVKGAAAELDAAYTTAQRAVDKLRQAGILQETTNQRRDRIYCAGEILAILEEPPRVMSVSAWREAEAVPELEIPEEAPEKTPARHDPAAKLPIVY